MAVKRNVVTFGFVSSLNYLVYKPGVLLLYWKSLRRRSFGSLWSAAMIYGYSYADSYRVSPQRFLLPFSFILFLCGCCFLCSAVLASVYGTRTCSWKEGRFTATKKEPGRRDTHKLRIRKPPPLPIPSLSVFLLLLYRMSLQCAPFDAVFVTAVGPF